MKIHSTLVKPGGAFLVMQDEDGQYHGFVSYGADQVRQVLATHAVGDQHAATVIGDLDEVPMPAEATRPTLHLTGTFVRMLAYMSAFAGKLAEGRRVAILNTCRAAICALFTSTDPGVQDALIGFVDPSGCHHIVAFFSKEQGVEVLAGMQSWLPHDVYQRASNMVAESGLPASSTRVVIDIEGELAGFLNSAHMVRKSARLRAN